jgi:spermidine synthase
VEQSLARSGFVSFPSRFNGKVHVKQRGRVRSLYLGRRLDIVHTRLNLDRPTALISPYQKCLLLGLGYFARPRSQVRRVAMVGLGGGAITRFFHAIWPSLVFHSVEIDPVVVAVARRLFGVRDTDTFRSYAADGRRFLAGAARTYDVIILDAFDAEASVPRALVSREFFAMLRRKLSPHGLLITNFLVHSRRVYASVIKTLKTAFPRIHRLPLRRFRSLNTLLFAPADPARLPSRATLRTRLSGITSLVGRKAFRKMRSPWSLAQCLAALARREMDLSRARIYRDPAPGPPSGR